MSAAGEAAGRWDRPAKAVEFWVADGAGTGTVKYRVELVTAHDAIRAPTHHLAVARDGKNLGYLRLDRGAVLEVIDPDRLTAGEIRGLFDLWRAIGEPTSWTTYH